MSDRLVDEVMRTNDLGGAMDILRNKINEAWKLANSNLPWTLRETAASDLVTLVAKWQLANTVAAFVEDTRLEDESDPRKLRDIRLMHHSVLAKLMNTVIHQNAVAAVDVMINSVQGLPKPELVAGYKHISDVILDKVVADTMAIYARQEH